jgi:hypothetical protein
MMVDDYSNMVVKKREFLGDLNRGTSKSSEIVVSFYESHWLWDILAVPEL